MMENIDLVSDGLKGTVQQLKVFEKKVDAVPTIKIVTKRSLRCLLKKCLRSKRIMPRPKYQC
jgi:hypothetical protein